MTGIPKEFHIHWLKIFFKFCLIYLACTCDWLSKMHIVYTRAKINIQFTWLHMYSVVEIRVRIWLAVF